MFIDIVRSWESSVYEMLINEAFAGYMAISKDMRWINEIVLLQENRFPEVIAAYIKAHGISEVDISLPLNEQNKIGILHEMCEECCLNSNVNFNVINYDKVIKAFLKCKASYTKLANGKLAISIREYGTICIDVHDILPSVRKFHFRTVKGSVYFEPCENCSRSKYNNVNVVKSGENGGIELDHLEAMQFLFSPVMQRQNLVGKSDLISSWLPIPLYISRQDKV